MQKQYRDWLIRKGYKEYSDRGNKSTVYNYIKRVETVCEIERCSWDQLADKIDVVIKSYDIGGEKAKIGNRSHRSVINALKRFQEFIGNR